ncbi:hypothetical protein BsIDN1_32920 [Bacillus safensis]|uniref:Uncharacterized protein n=1 Tax=Bacillus safensis TaxID=561879 RepID=A0A5S9MBZ4_BACIA|nr:hypothetical protein BsIDN1_32920 [Bacillus safensis]
MGYVLSITGSYVLSIIFSILVPSFLSILLTAYSFEYTKKDTPEDLEENEGASGNSFLMNVRGASCFVWCCHLIFVIFRIIFITSFVVSSEDDG